MSFNKPLTRQEGFSPDDLFSSSNPGFHTKYPSSPLNLPSMDFGDELAGLMAADSNGNANSRSSPPNGYHHHQHLHQDDHYRTTTHNIFDTSSVSSRPHAIVIPGSGRGGGGGGGAGSWFVNGQSSPHPTHQSRSLSLGGAGTSHHHSHSHSHHPNSHSITIPKSPIEFTPSTSSSATASNSSQAQQLASPLLTTNPLVGNGNANSSSHSLSHGHQHHLAQQQQHHPPSLSHSLSHSGTLTSMGSMGMGTFGSMGGMNGMGMNNLSMMGMTGMANGGLSLGPINPIQSPSLQSSSLSTPTNNNNSSLSTSLPSSQPQPPLLNSSSIPSNSTDKQSMLANEKRRRRRESHNAVERRRRDNINEKISELATLIPECMLEGGPSSANGGSSSPSHITSTSPSSGIGLSDGSDPLLPSSFSFNGNGSSSPIKEENGAAGEEGGGIVKANKGMILRKSVDYIRYLQQLVTAQGARNRELEQELKAYRQSSDSPSGSIDSDSPKINGYQHQQQKRSSTIGGGPRIIPHSTSSPSDESKEDGDDCMMMHDGVDGIGPGGVIEFGSYGGGGNGGDGRGRLPSMPEGDDENGDESSHHHHHHHHQNHQQQHHRHQPEDMEVDNLGMNINMAGGMGMMSMQGGMNTMNGYNTLDNAASENLRGRTRVVRRGSSITSTTTNGATAATDISLKEEMGDDNDVLAAGRFGIGRTRVM